MATRQTEFSISIEKLEIKFKGTHELGQQIQQGVTHAIGGLMNAQARLLAAPPEPGQVIDAEVSDTGAPKANGHGSPDANGEKPKQPRQRRAKGVSLVGLVRDLKQEGFFGQTRSVGDVLDKLKLKGHTIKRTTLSSRLQELTQAGELHRDRNGDGPFIYKDTPFNEGPRSPSPADQPAQ